MPLPSPADVRGAVRLAAEAVVGVTDIVEAAHATVASPAGRPGRARGVAGAVYRAVRWTARRVGRGLVGAVTLAERTGWGGRGGEVGARDAVVAALNGVFGDGLADRDNPLATPVGLRYAGRSFTPECLALAVPEPSGVLLVLLHGSSMHEGQWGSADHDPPAALAAVLGATPVALRYNSGRHVSQNGRDAADALDALVRAWPRAVRRVVVVGHSMGGLVARSAFHYGAEAGHGWVGLDAALVTLGTPHHGAPLERLGNRVDALLGATRWTAPFARIGQARSAGVTDLRYGSVRDEDWAGRDRFASGPDARVPLPLPDGVACYLVAATTGDGRGGLRDRTVGDGLVPLDSALGRHADPARALRVPSSRTHVFAGMTHFDLLRRPEVTARLLAWLAPPASGPEPPGRGVSTGR